MSEKYVVEEPADWSFDRAGVRGKLFPAGELTNSCEQLIIETETGHETTIVEDECDFIYYVLEGQGSFEINGEHLPCETGNLVVVPHGNAFSYAGRLRMLLTCTPPWSPEQEKVL
jgi:mannose-6-phosphate isomerase-like protein (cupin superfamily)